MPNGADISDKITLWLGDIGHTNGLELEIGLQLGLRLAGHGVSGHGFAGDDVLQLTVGETHPCLKGTRNQNVMQPDHDVDDQLLELELRVGLGIGIGDIGLELGLVGLEIGLVGLELGLDRLELGLGLGLGLGLVIDEEDLGLGLGLDVLGAVGTSSGTLNESGTSSLGEMKAPLDLGVDDVLQMTVGETHPCLKGTRNENVMQPDHDVDEELLENHQIGQIHSRFHSHFH